MTTGAFSEIRKNRLDAIASELRVRGKEKISYTEFFGVKSFLFGLKRETMASYFSTLEDAKLIKIDRLNDLISYSGADL